MEDNAARGHLTRQAVPRMFVLCWLAYFAANLARLSYTVSMAEILRANGWANASAGLISTVFFASYGLGQLLSGTVGDHVPPRHMVGIGLFASAGANLAMGLLSSPGAMAVVWCLHGLVQSALWTPILRILSEDFPPETRKKACVNMATTYPVACMVMYMGGAGLIALGGWRPVFFATALLLAAMAAAWQLAFPRLDGCRTPYVAPAVAPRRDSAAKKGTGFPVVALLFICAALVVQGVLRDGVTGWVPPYLSNVFGTGAAFAILSTTLLPVVNLAGVYAANALHRRSGSETVVAAGLFAVACGAAVVLLCFGTRSYWLALVCFGCVTSCMLGVNVMLVSLVPASFASLHRVSMIGGLTNAMVYLGSSVATWGFGAVADAWGWGHILALLVGMALLGAVLCLCGAPFWRRFCHEIYAKGEE